MSIDFIEAFNAILEAQELITGENKRQFEGFITYCRLSLADEKNKMNIISDNTGVTINTVYNWSSSNNWKKRYTDIYSKALIKTIDTIGDSSILAANNSIKNMSVLQNRALKDGNLENYFKLAVEEGKMSINSLLYIIKEAEYIKKLHYQNMFGSKFDEIGIVGIKNELKNNQPKDDTLKLDETKNIERALRSIDENKEIKDIKTIIKDQKEKMERMKEEEEEKEKEKEARKAEKEAKKKNKK